MEDWKNIIPVLKDIGELCEKHNMTYDELINFCNSLKYNEKYNANAKEAK